MDDPGRSDAAIVAWAKASLRHSGCELPECPGVVAVDRFTVASFLLLFFY
jgi:hypothetical protein